MAQKITRDDNLIQKVANAIRSVSEPTYESYIATAYMLLKINEFGIGERDSLVENNNYFFERSKLSEERRMFINRHLDIANNWNELVDMGLSFTREALVNTILFIVDQNTQKYGGLDSTPDCINQLATKILGIDDGEKVADLCCGIGSFLTLAANNYDIEIYGSEINPSSWVISQIRLELLTDKAEIKLRNSLDEDLSNIKADKAFSNYPWAVRTDLVAEDSYLGSLIAKTPMNNKNSVSDWIFNYALVNSIKKTGMAIGIMTNGSTFSSGSGKAVRKFFLENGYIKAVIALPSNLFNGTSIPVTMIVLSHENKDVMLVNAIDLFEQGRRKNTISEVDIERIAAACISESSISKRFTTAEIAENDYYLNPSRYFAGEIAVESGTPFKEIIKSVSRGAQIKAQELDKNSTVEETPYQYLMLSDITDGLINDNLPYLASLDPKQNKYCLKNGDIIISKIGTPTKVAVAEIKEGKNILANGNLYIVEIDTQKADPYYIKAFLESKKGQELISREQVGTYMTSISLEKLKEIPIPLIPIEKQRELGQLYHAKIDSLKLQKMRYEKTLDEIRNIYEIWEGGI